MTWSVPDRSIMSSLRGRCGTVNIHPVFKFNKLKAFPGEKLTRNMAFRGGKLTRIMAFPGGEIDQNHVDKRILGGKGLKTQQA